jgi:hypothetical protein
MIKTGFVTLTLISIFLFSVSLSAQHGIDGNRIRQCGTRVNNLDENILGLIDNAENNILVACEQNTSFSDFSFPYSITELGRPMTLEVKAGARHNCNLGEVFEKDASFQYRFDLLNKYELDDDEYKSLCKPTKSNAFEDYWRKEVVLARSYNEQGNLTLAKKFCIEPLNVKELISVDVYRNIDCVTYANNIHAQTGQDVWLTVLTCWFDTRLTASSDIEKRTNLLKENSKFFIADKTCYFVNKQSVKEKYFSK